MVRADLLDCVDKFLRLNGPSAKQPFGGLQMIFIGDLYQLPPVVGKEETEIFKTHYATPYFFSAKVFAKFTLTFIELEKIYRQHDDKFIRMLNAIRNSSIDEKLLAELNRRLDPEFRAPPDQFFIHLTTTNARADEINAAELAKLSGKEFHSTGLIEGSFGKEYLPTAENLALKIGAQVMLLTNDPGGRWVNGTIAKITNFNKKEEVVTIELPNGKKTNVSSFMWEIFRYRVEGRKLKSESVGTFTQLPLRLAFAVTIHKSQGKTFERVVIDLGRGTFAHGQLYVALSRCTTLAGLVLRQPVKKGHIRLDWGIPKFLTRYQYQIATEKLPLSEKIALIEQTIKTKGTLKMVYLKGKDEKSRRNIRPLRTGPMEYAGKPFLGLEAFCLMRKEERVFNVERILELEVAK